MSHIVADKPKYDKHIEDEITFNPYSKEYRENPYEFYKILREKAPILNIGNDTYLISKYADVRTVMSNKTMSVRHIPNTIKELSDEFKPNLDELGRLAVVFTDPPEHSRLRKLMNKAFNRQSIQSFSSVIDMTVNDIIQSKINTGYFDFVGDVAHKVPLYLVSRLLGVNEKDIPLLDQRLSFLRQTLDPTLYTTRRINKFEISLDECIGIFSELIENMSDDSDGSLLGKMIHSTIDDDQLNKEEIIIGCILTYIAGHETTKSVIGTGLLNLIRNKEQWNLLKSNPELIDIAIEEILRFDPPLLKTMRIAEEEINLSGIKIKNGDKLLLNIASACHDENIYPDSENFDINRDYIENLSFGFGMHNCIGKYLAKAEVKSVIQCLIHKVDEISLDETYVDEYEYLGITARTLKSLPLKLVGTL